MINYKQEIAKILDDKLVDLSLEEIENMLEIPADSKMGDFAFPCFKLARTLRKAPPLIAKDIVAQLEGNALFEKVEAVNAYVNMFISKEMLLKNTVESTFEMGADFGKSQIGEGKTVVIDYSSPNIAKPFHIGHIRSTVIGNALYKIYDALGYDVVRINHLGDYGTQFGKMICAYRKWGNKEDVEREPIKTLLSYYTKFHEEAEKDPSLDDEARDIFAALENGAKEEVALWQWFRDESLKEFNRVYEMLDISFDSYNGESFYSDKMPAVIQELRDKALLVPSQGTEIVELEQFGLTDAPIVKANGSSLYITRDIAAAIYRKNTYDFYKDIYVVASQQNLHFQQLKKIIELMGYDWADKIEHVPFGLVSLEEGTMSTRHGRVVFLEDVLNHAVDKTREIIKDKGVVTENIDETAAMVGIGAVVFNELSNNRIKDYVFSYDKVLNFDGETGPYVQYTHARALSVLRKAGVEDIDLSKIDYSYLKGEAATNLAMDIYKLPEVIVEAASKNEPSVVTRHVVDLAQSFNKFYHDEHILVENEDEKLAKLALVKAGQIAIKNGLNILGVKAPEKM
ncbi:MAG: arginine--tRNA ligase [Clostridia bacterium]|nr:arginine--tRNA ligase [Clostridia bacterium]